MLELFDGACCLMRGKAKPRAWTDATVKVAKAFAAEMRTDAASSAQVCKRSYLCPILVSLVQDALLMVQYWWTAFYKI